MTELGETISEAVLEATRQQVEREMNDYLRTQRGVDLNDPDIPASEHPFRLYYLGNPWLTKLPNPSAEGGRYTASIVNIVPDFMEITPLQFRERENARRREKYPDQIKFIEEEEKMDEEDRAMGRGHSELYLNQPHGKFYETVDKALEAEGISIEEVGRLQTQSSKELDFDLQEKLLRLTFPAYVRLRALGYNHYDLTA